MSTFDSAAIWSATSLAFDEKKIGAAGLSVRQRKLLTLLSQPASLPQLAQSIALPIEDVRAALERFAKLGLAQSSDAVPLSPMQTQLRSPSAVVSPSRMPLMIGVAVAVLAAVGAGAWLLRGGGGPSTTSAPVAAPATAQAPTATGPSDTADNGLPGPVTRTVAAAPVTAPANAAVNAAAVTPGRPAATPVAPIAPVTPPAAVVAAAVVPPTIAPTAASSTVAPSPVAPTTPALTLATALPAVPAAQPAAAPAVGVPATPAPAAQVATAPAASPPPAAARPAPAVAREIKLVNRVEPTFPRGYDADKGTVRARLQVDARGAVTGVDIVEASPPRVFDRSVRTALQQWRYEPTGEAFSVIAEINFSR
jgi:periplasmic protein TonB